jgi:arginyl-tRNA--protein-N-Asp/Glu arginylyltransferase
MSSLKTLIFFATPEHDCSYLDDREATTMFVDPRAQVDKRLYSQLTALGFRRSGSHYYRPHCETCNACIPVRVPASRFHPNRNQKRVLKTNSDIEFRLMPVQYRDEYYALYDRYISERHEDGDMYPPSRDQFTSFLVEGAIDSFFLEMRLSDNTLLGLAVIDLLDDGLSAIYTIFDPRAESRSLGTLAVLWQIDEARRRKLPHVYLGYWIRECRKMSYKNRFQPLQKLHQGRWMDVLASD